MARSLAEGARKLGLPVVALGRPELDIADPQSIERAFAAFMPSIVVNAAAYTAVDTAESDADRAFAVNRDGAGRIAAAASAAGVPFIHISSDYVFDGSKSMPYVEEDDPHPLGVYGQSKLEGEHAVRDAHPDAVVLRTSWVYSPYGHNFLKTMLGLAATRETVSVVDDQYGTPTAAPDLASAILDLAQSILRDGSKSGVYHLTSAGSTTWYGFAAAIFDGWKERGHRVPALRRIRTSEYPTPTRRPANSRLDCTKIHRMYGIRLPDWRDSLGECLDTVASAEIGRGP
ncbi:MAG TPA: dTDP-4-dehydrorhamnose reductase [Hyphomicrobiaceae bacterium]|nr:dTDP-4-dehydrorhamnose reductase [Hyphomicrobiaceae bacterium]